MNDRQAWAERYAALGWAPFPVQRDDKAPACERGFHAATTDVERIREFWPQGSKLNIGLAIPRGHVVVDIDNREAMLALRSLDRELPTTSTARTPRGGWHLVYRLPDGVDVRQTVGRIADGVDTRTAGHGYIVVEPSTVNGGSYHWETPPVPDNITEAPSWLIEVLTEHREPAAPVGGEILKGRRNDTLASMAGSMRRRGMEIDEIAAALHVVNQKRCHPPLSDDEVEAVARSISRYAPAVEETTRPASSGLRFTPASELLRDRPDEPDWTWWGAIVRGAVTLVVGRPKSGKSTLLYALADAAARREVLFLGRALRGGPVVYASEESAATLATTFPRHPDVHLVTRDAAWPKPPWPELVAAAAAKVREVGAALCVVDTFAFWNGLGGDQEQAAGAVQPLLDVLVEVTATGCSVALAHHHRKAPGEDGTAIRGSSAIAGAVDAFMEVEPVRDAPSNQRQLVVTAKWPAPPVLVVEWTPGGYRVVGEAGSREEAAEKSWPRRLLDALPDEGDGATYEDLEELLDADRRKWMKPLKRLVREGRVERTGEGRKGSPYRHRITAPVPFPGSLPETEEGMEGIAGEPPSVSIPSPLGGERNKRDDSHLAESDPVPVEEGKAVDRLGRCRRCGSTSCNGCGDSEEAEQWEK